MTKLEKYKRNFQKVDGETSPIEYYLVLPIAGQSNGMAYGEGLPLPDTLDKPDPAIMQLARRGSVTPGGKKCRYNEPILADHCLHDVQDMSVFNHPLADLDKGQYGCVSQGLHIAKSLRAHLPRHIGILLVPCCRGGSAFTQGEYGSFSPDSGACNKASRWGINTPLYMDLISRTKAALDLNSRNILVGVCWMQGEFDLSSLQYEKQPALFNEMVAAFRHDISSHHLQCINFNEKYLPWFCGDTTYYWRETYPRAYHTVYGNYQKRAHENIFFVNFSDTEITTNEPIEDPDIPETGYLGSSHRTRENWTTDLRSSHFSTHARRGIIANRFSDAILSAIQDKDVRLTHAINS